VAASHVHGGRCDGGDRRGESLIESVNHIERGLSHFGFSLATRLPSSALRAYPSIGRNCG